VPSVSDDRPVSARTTDPAPLARAPRLRSQGIADHFIAQVLDQQPPEAAPFMLDTSVLSELSADTCAVTAGSSARYRATLQDSRCCLERSRSA
jgi:ATP/maltotriose-dependent transcriptional regulator MalT